MAGIFAERPDESGYCEHLSEHPAAHTGGSGIAPLLSGKSRLPTCPSSLFSDFGPCLKIGNAARLYRKIKTDTERKRGRPVFSAVAGALGEWNLCETSFPTEPDVRPAGLVGGR